MKDFNGEKIFCLENDKETYRDMVFELQERIDKALEYIDRRDIDWGSEQHDKLVNILKGSDSNE